MDPPTSCDPVRRCQSPAAPRMPVTSHLITAFAGRSETCPHFISSFRLTREIFSTANWKSTMKTNGLTEKFSIVRQHNENTVNLLPKCAEIYILIPNCIGHMSYSLTYPYHYSSVKINSSKFLFPFYTFDLYIFIYTMYIYVYIYTLTGRTGSSALVWHTSGRVYEPRLLQKILRWG